MKIYVYGKRNVLLEKQQSRVARLPTINYNIKTKQGKKMALKNIR